MKKNTIIFIVHNRRWFEPEIDFLRDIGKFQVEHFFEHKEAEEFIETHRDEIFCIILDTAYIANDHRYEKYLELKKSILKGVNVLVTEILRNTYEVNSDTKLIDNDKFVKYNDIFSQAVIKNAINRLKELFPVS